MKIKFFICTLVPLLLSGGAPSFERIKAGAINEVYLSTNWNGEKRVVKVYKNKPMEQLEASTALCIEARKKGVRSPEILIPHFAVGEKKIAVFEYIEGKHIEDRHVPEVAAIMARLHQLPIEHQKRPRKDDYDALLLPLFERCKEWAYCAILKEIYDGIDFSYLDRLPTGLIHGDFSYTNLLVDASGDLVLLDFDLMRHEYLLTDLVRCQAFYGFDGEGILKEEFVKNFLFRYQCIRPLEQVEIDSFYTHMKVCLLELCLEFYELLHIKKDVDLSIVYEHPLNFHLNPNLIAKEILFIKDRSSLLDFESKALPGILIEGTDFTGKTSVCQSLQKKLSDSSILRSIYGENIEAVELNSYFLSCTPFIQHFKGSAKKAPDLLESSWCLAAAICFERNLFEPAPSTFYVQDRNWLSQECRLKFFHSETAMIPSLPHRPFTWNVYLTANAQVRQARAAGRADLSLLDAYFLKNIEKLMEYDRFCMERIPKSENWIVIDTSDLSVDEIVSKILHWMVEGDHSWYKASIPGR